jgi:hypothetical protein
MDIQLILAAPLMPLLHDHACGSTVLSVKLAMCLSCTLVSPRYGAR